MRNGKWKTEIQTGKPGFLRFVAVTPSSAPFAQGWYKKHEMKFKNIQERFGGRILYFFKNIISHKKTAFKVLTPLQRHLFFNYFSYFFLYLIKWTGLKNFKNIQEHSVQIQEHSRLLEWNHKTQEHSRLSAPCMNPAYAVASDQRLVLPAGQSLWLAAGQAPGVTCWSEFVTCSRTGSWCYLLVGVCDLQQDRRLVLPAGQSLWLAAGQVAGVTCWSEFVTCSRTGAWCYLLVGVCELAAGQVAGVRPDQLLLVHRILVEAQRVDGTLVVQPAA